MKISRFRWTADRIDHIAKHGLEQYEVEQAAFDDPHILINKSVVSLNNLALFFIPQGHGTIYPVTAREMNVKEKRLYKSGCKS